jgi:short-subunit dehydrogenase
MTKLSKKVIWITGASSGIGEALTYGLAKQGAKLILSARRKEELDRVKGNCPVAMQQDIRILPLDLTEASTLKLCAEAAIQLFGHIDILINNAGISQRSLVKETLIDVDRRLMELNYFAPVALTKYLLPHFVNRKAGHYVCISSLTGKFGTPLRSGYAASKHALHGFFDAVRAEHFNDNIKVTLVCPGFIDTPISRSSITGNGSTLQKSPEGNYNRKSAIWCAKKIIKAIEKQKQEVYIGGLEVLVVYMKRFFPSLFSFLIRKVAVR